MIFHGIKFIECERPVSEHEIRKIEKMLDCKFPEMYKDFLVVCNGGYPSEKDFFPMLEKTFYGESSGSIGRMFSTDEGEFYNLIRENNTYKSRLPKHLLAIGENGMGDLICLCMEGENYGKVYFWDHNWEAEDGEEPTYRNVHLIANSFKDFINSLYKENE